MGGSKKHKQNGQFNKAQAFAEALEESKKMSEKRIEMTHNAILDAVDKVTNDDKFPGHLTTPEAVKVMLLVANSFNNQQLNYQRENEVQMKKP